MADSSTPNVVDGVEEPERDLLVLALEEARLAWLEKIDRGGDRIFEPGAAGEWSMRDVVVHINAYYRFLVSQMGGNARPFADLPGDAGDAQRRNEILHAQDIDQPWSESFRESIEIHDELVRLVSGWSQEELRQPMVDWHTWPRWRWIVGLTLGHYEEYNPDATKWLESL